MLVKPKTDPVAVVGAFTTQKSDGTELAIEIRRAVYGLTTPDLTRMTEISQSGNVYVVMEPHLVLKGKLANLADLPQASRQDARHVLLLIPCVRCYLEDNHGAVIAGSKSPSDLVSLLNETSAVLSSQYAASAAKKLAVSFSSIISPQLLLSQNPDVRNAAENASSSIAFHTWYDPSPRLDSSLSTPIAPTSTQSVDTGLSP